MNIPRFTADLSLYRREEPYQATRRAIQDERGIYPARLAAMPFPDAAIDFLQPFREPQCLRICLASWGGHCRWICI